MDNIDNNQFEVKPLNSKRKIQTPHLNVYMNPALDILANEDRICNTIMEVPTKKRKRTKSLDLTTFENTALDSEVQSAPTNQFLVKELDNVRRNVKLYSIDEHTGVTDAPSCQMSFRLSLDDNTHLKPQPNLKISNLSADNTQNNYSIPNNTLLRKASSLEAFNITGLPITDNLEPIYANLTDISNNIESLNVSNKLEEITPALPPRNTVIAQENIDKTTDSINETNQIYTYQNKDSNPPQINKNNTLFTTDISRINHDDFDSGISVLEPKSDVNIQVQQTVVNSNLSLSFIDRLAIDSPSEGSLYLDDDLNESNIMEIKTITIITTKKKRVEKKNTNPFLDPNLKTEETTNSSNPFLDIKPEIEYQEEFLNRPTEVPNPNNILVPRRLFGDTNSTISTVDDTMDHEYENIRPESPVYENIDFNKQSKLLGCDVSQFSATDILNLHANNSNDSNDSKKKKSLLKAGNKLSKKVFKTLKKTFKNEKHSNTTLNPYEVPRKPPKTKADKKESGIENPALNLDNSDDLEIEELSDEEHQYETIKTIRNTQLNMNVTPLKAKENELDVPRTYTPGKKVRFDSTLNQEKVITGNSFDFDMQSPGFDIKIEKYHDELENCINERKFLQQNM